MSGSCEVPNCKAPARFSVEFGVDNERAELCPRHTDYAITLGAKRLRRLAVAA